MHCILRYRVSYKTLAKPKILNHFEQEEWEIFWHNDFSFLHWAQKEMEFNMMERLLTYGACLFETTQYQKTCTIIQQ